jgi:adenosylcobinamide kinase/adenosylcobinamide-phosphate guanylyltransferase
MIDLPGAIDKCTPFDVVLVDCLTMWVNNLMYEADQANRTFTEPNISELCESLIKATRRIRGTVIFVTNEVGMGIVPETEIGRRFRDLAGRCNQLIAQEADEAILLISGLPVHMKGRNS